VLLNTDPNRPPVAYTTLDDMPFIVKGNEELPSGVMDPNELLWRQTARAEGALQTYMASPANVWQSFT
jgi:hypothetical protein